MKRNSLAIDRYVEVLIRRKWALLIPLAMSLVAAAVILARLPDTPDEYESVATVRLALAGRPTGAVISPTDAAVIANTANYVLQSDDTLAELRLLPGGTARCGDGGRVFSQLWLGNANRCSHSDGPHRRPRHRLSHRVHGPHD